MDARLATNGAGKTPADHAISATREELARLRGRLFGTVEAIGLPEKQEAALKGLVRQLTYDCQSNLEATLRGKGA